ncbi:MAG TPA: lipid-A-disaccharide synthase [Fulvivirga sp.]|nr:lipid-A-disaccharide synthase [Fulvivirga sp.]
MKYFIVAGERSGDLHGGNLVKELKALDKEATFTGFGGDYMASNGVDIKVHYKELAFMGFLEVVLNLFKIRAYLKQCKNEIDHFQPDAIILIDYGGFNMKIAKYAKANGIAVHYYISPKVWAWNQNRALKLKKIVDRMYVILPFEKAFFQKFDWKVNYVGNPVLDAVKAHSKKPISIENKDKDIVAILPGSRLQEITSVLTGIKEVIKSLPNAYFVIAAVDNIDSHVYDQVRDFPNVEFVYDRTYDLLAVSKVAIVTSGTATLETALWKVPQIVIYKTSGLSYSIAKRLIKVNYISLVNLIIGKLLVKELIQNDFNHVNLSTELETLLDNDNYRNKMIEGYNEIERMLDTGSASSNTANLIYKYCVENKA